MKNKKCRKNFFWEAVRQIKVTGIIGIVIYVVVCLAVTIGNNIILSHTAGTAIGQKDSIMCLRYNAMSLSLEFIPIMLVPIMMMGAFRFIDSRKDSDFYFSMPVRRRRIYADFMAAVLFWAAMMILSAAVTVSICGMALRYISVDMKSVLMAAITTISGCIFMMGVFGVGISLTGTVSSNMIASIFVMLVPRAVISTFVLIISLGTEFSYSASVFLELLSKTSSLVCTILQFDLFDNMTAGMGLIAFSSVFSIIEGSLYILAGGFIFTKRKSETSGKSSMSPIVQKVLRMVIPYLLCLAGDCLLVYGASADEGDDRSVMLFYVVIMFVLAILFYFIYELICSRKWKTVIKSARQLPVLAILAVLSFGVMELAIHIGNGYMPQKSDIKYIEIEDDCFPEHSGNVKLKSDEAKEIIATAYERQNNPNAIYPESTFDLNVHIGDGLFGHRRTVYVTSNEGIKLARAIMNDPEFKGKKEMLPPEKAVNIGMGYSTDNIYFDGIADVYTTLYEELSDRTRLVDAVINSYSGNGILGVWAYDSPLSSFNEYDSWIPGFYQEKSRESKYYTRIQLSFSTPKTVKLVQGLLDSEFGEMTYKEALSECANENGHFLAHYCLSGIDDKDYDEGINAGATSATQEITGEIGKIIAGYDRYGDASAPNTLIVQIYSGSNFEKMFIGVYNLSVEDAREVKKLIAKQGYFGEYYGIVPATEYDNSDITDDMNFEETEPVQD